MYIRVGILLVVSGCSTHHPYPHIDVQPPSLSGTTPSARLLVRIDTPVTDESPTHHVGYGGRLQNDLIITAKHLIPDYLPRLVIHNDAGTACPIKQIRDHPIYDLSVIQTSIACSKEDTTTVLEATLDTSGTLIYIQNDKPKKTAYTRGDSTLLLPEYLLPGMSGTPLFTETGILVGIISQQVETGTEAIRIHKKMLLEREDLPPEIQRLGL